MLDLAENEICSIFRHVRKISKINCHLISPFSHPSIRMKPFGYHWKNFHSIRYWNIIRKSVQKIHISLKSDKKNRYFT